MPAAVSVAVIAPSDDPHARLVTDALARLGHAPLWITGSSSLQADPTTIAISCLPPAGGPPDIGTAAARPAPRTVWNRRPAGFDAPDFLHPQDRDYARAQMKSFQAAIQSEWGASRWVNPVAAAAAARCKLSQLKLAAQSGLPIPRTIMGNDPAAIRAFCRDTVHCIHKPFRGHEWVEDGVSRATFTSVVTPEQLPSDRVLRASPGIYQEHIHRTREIRLQVFGRTVLAACISGIPADQADYRINQNRGRSVEPVTAPAHVLEGCFRVMSGLGIVSGAFDFVVDQAGNWIFLEVNESGQFLFLEKWCPAIPVLDAFVGFLVSGDDDYRHRAGEPGIRLADLDGPALSRQASASQEPEPGLASLDAGLATA